MNPRRNAPESKAQQVWRQLALISGGLALTGGAGAILASQIGLEDLRQMGTAAVIVFAAPLLGCTLMYFIMDVAQRRRARRQGSTP